MGRYKRGKSGDIYHHYDPNSKKHRRSSSSTSPTTRTTANLHSASLNLYTKRPLFPSYLETPNLPPVVKLLCEVIANTPSSSIEPFFDNAGIRVSQSDVEQVLKLSYSFPGSAVKFFRWAGLQLHDNHSPYSWNLVVDLLGKNSLFDSMWDAIKSMKREGLVSLATFASVFGSYILAGKVKEAIMTFDLMDQYGCSRDVVALNSLLSAICRDGKTSDALEFFHVARNVIRPDADTYSILLEGWEKERDVANARKTFAEMVSEIGWNPDNVPAYDTILCTFLMGRDGLNEAIEFMEMMKDRRCGPGMRFFRAVLQECLKATDVRRATLIWEAMVERNGLRPDTELYNSMIALYCYTNNIDAALRFFREMIYNGAFPDRQTYNTLFKFLIKSRNLKEASVMFDEMIKNEFVPDQANCSAAVRVYLHSEEPYMAVKVWKCMIENYELDLEETGNLLVAGLCDLHMDPEAVKYTEDMIRKGIKVSSSSLGKLKQTLIQARKEFVYEALLRK
ncbi:pentatricopeptide repeat-containing protein At1g77360, mitochondrial-like [Euphorbia lathyris]|uniref:pentatricopeptide repeat-containing protein At1g77360, mitochondrial-like n=1 Tax=Euphorbia lathyris TaxID=212925 RepID=UPI003313ECC6